MYLRKCRLQREHTTVICMSTVNCIDYTLVSNGAHGHIDVCVWAWVCEHILPVRLLAVSSSGFILGIEFKSVKKSNDG